MIKIDNTETFGWEAAIRGMRNPMNSWGKSDSGTCYKEVTCHTCQNDRNHCKTNMEKENFVIGYNDLNLMKRLAKAGTDHRKYLRMITVYCDITAPLYWLSELDTYKIGVVRNSCSFMHKGVSVPYGINDFSLKDERIYEVLNDLEMKKCTLSKPEGCDQVNHINGDKGDHSENEELFQECLLWERLINWLNSMRELYLDTKDECIFQQIRALMPQGYMQKSTYMFNYEVLANIYKSRKNHRLDEWRTFCDWIKTLPYSELITGEEYKEN